MSEPKLTEAQREALARAWDEGYEACAEHWGVLRPPDTVNPYRDKPPNWGYLGDAMKSTPNA